MSVWNKKLNKKELKHLKENGVSRKYKFVEQIKFLKEQKKIHPNGHLCWDCYMIAKKLDMWGDN